MQAPVFQIGISTEDQQTGVNLISFVANPAIEADFVALSAHKLHLATDGMKQILTGPVLIPDKQIFRKDEEGKPFYIVFTSEVIEGIRNKFHKEKHTHATNDEHAVALDGNYVVESWIIADAEKDKAVALGLSDLPAGTWMVSYHVPDADYWEKEILSGNKRGFSLEGFFNYEEVKAELSKLHAPKSTAQNLTPDMSNTTKKPGLLARMKAKLAALLLSVLALADGTSIEVDDDTKEVFKLDDEGNRTEPLADGTYELSDGSTIEVADGKLKEAAADGDAEEANLEATVLSDGSYELPGGDVLTIAEGAYAIVQAGGEAAAEEATEEIAAELAALKEQVKAKDGEIAKLSATVEAQKVQLSRKPSTQPVKLGGDKDKDVDVGKTPAQVRLAEVRARNKK